MPIFLIGVNAPPTPRLPQERPSHLAHRLSKIQGLLPNLTPVEAHAATQLSDDPRMIFDASIGELALALAWRFSQPALCRPLEALGCNGLQALRVQVS